VTYQSDAGGVEVTLLDCPADQENGVTLPPLEYLARGPEGCLLGQTRDQIKAKWAGPAPEAGSDGSLLLRLPKGNTYDALMVTFEKDRAVRILAYHAQADQTAPQPEQLAAALTDAWGRDMAGLGWVRRQEVTAKGQLQGYDWHDEVTRVRIFWQEPNGQGAARLYTEWKALRPGS